MLSVLNTEKGSNPNFRIKFKFILIKHSWEILRFCQCPWFLWNALKMERLQVLGPFCKAWMITLENFSEKESFINEVGWNALYHTMTIRVLFFWNHTGLVFGSNASNHGRQKKKIIFLMLMIPVLGPDLKTRKDLEVYTHLMTAFYKISFFYISWQEHFFLSWNPTF